jgi:O-antigen biosynthesis protein WbqP
VGANPSKRIFDLLLGLLAAVVLVLPIALIAILVRLTSKGPILYWSDRVGKNNQIFRMPKFRSMLVGTPTVATHLLANPNSYLTPIGSFLRKSSLDELPQLWSILKGDMSFVGPRPNLYNQHELINERNNRGVYQVRPGITGLAQINKIDMSTPQLLAETDAKMIAEMTVSNYFKYIFLTGYFAKKRQNSFFLQFLFYQHHRCLLLFFLDLLIYSLFY